VPPILLANEQKIQYVGNKNQTQWVAMQDYVSPSQTYSN